jgi:hypothetical protein
MLNTFSFYSLQYINIVTYDSAKPRVITLRETLKKSSQHYMWGDEVQEIATT